MDYSNFCEWILDINDNIKFDNFDLDVERINLFLKHHKLHSYFSKKMIKKNVNNDLLKSTEEAINNISIDYKKRWDFLHQIAKELEFPIFTFKGFCNHLIEKTEIPLKSSRDLDLCYKEPFKLQKLLIQKGFYIAKENDDHSITLRLDRTDTDLHSFNVDLHKYFPIPLYPDDIEKVRGTNDKTESGISFLNSLDYQQFMYNSIEIHKNIYIPNVTLAVVISSINLFKDYIMRINRIPVCSLVEILDIKQLIGNSNYNEILLQELLDRLQAYDAIEFVGKVFQDFYQYNPFEKLIKKPKSNMPQLLIWNFNSWFIPPSFQNTLINDRYKNVINNLNFNEVYLKKNKVVNLSNNIDLNSSVSCYYHSTESQKDFSFYLQVSIEEEFKLSFVLKNMGDLNVKDIVSFEFGTHKQTFFAAISKKKYLEKGEIDHKYLFYDEEKDEIRVNLTFTAEKMATLLEENTIPLSLYFEKHFKESEIDCLIPIMFVFDESEIL